MHISDAQAGGKKGRSTCDHILAVKELIDISKKLQKPLYTVFLDVSKAYDKAWLDALLYSAYNRGLRGNTWQLIKELNSDLSAKVRTKHGNTREIRLNNVMRQGGVSATHLYSGHIDDTTVLSKKLNLGVTVNSHGDLIAVIHWVDDIFGAETNPRDFQKLLDAINEIRNRYHIEFREEKSKVMIIGGKKDTPRPIFKIGDITLEYTEKYKYLGEVINSKNNLENQIEELEKKIEGAYQTILKVAKDRVFKNIEMETIWKLLETSIQAIILYGSETWNPRKKDWAELNKLQDSLIKRILMTPITTPTEALYT